MNGITKYNIKNTNGITSLQLSNIILDVKDSVLYTDTTGLVSGINYSPGNNLALFTDNNALVFRQITLSDIDFGLTANRVIISDSSGGLTSSNITTTQLNQISTNTYTYSDSTTNLNLIYNYDATYKNSFIVQQYNSMY